MYSKSLYVTVKLRLGFGTFGFLRFSLNREVLIVLSIEVISLHYKVREILNFLKTVYKKVTLLYFVFMGQ